MKFGQYLLKNQYSPWHKEYLQYDQLKKVIKRASQPSLLTNEENDHLKELLVIEYDKIDQFIKTQCQYINQQFVHIKQQQQEEKNGLSNLETLLYYLYDLSRLIDLSMIGFQKLSKSWQKHGYTIQFDTWQQLKDYFVLLDEWLIDLANLKQEYEHYQLQLNNTCSLSPTSSTSTKHTFSSSSSSIIKHYWVHPNHIYELKLLLLFYMDLKEYHDQHTTAFLDDNQWNVYNQLLNHHQNVAGFESIEFSEEPFVNNNSIKIRHNINTFIPSQDAFKTEYNTITSTKEYLDDITAMTIKTAKNDQEKNKNLVTKEIQLHSKINQYGWQPTLQYDKQRLVYQSTTAHSLTFYLDTHIQLKQKDEKKEMNWGLLSIEFMMDDGDDDYKRMKKEDECIEKEINLPLPNWFQHILHHGFWLHEVPSFSMYVHGVSLLYSESIAFLPWWLQWLEQWDEMEQQQQPLYEIEKESHRVGLSRSTDLQPLLNGDASPWHHHGSSSQTIINFEHEDIFNLLEKKKDEQNEDYLLPPPYLLTATTKTATTTTTTAAALLKRKNKNKKKKIKDIKVEPKTFFALERTFLAWLQFCALILTISLNLMNFGRDDPISKNCGGAFILLTVCMAIYALIQYVSRAWQLKFKSPLYRFDDIYGPAVLCILLILAMLVNFGLRITHPLHYDDNSTTTFLNNTTLNNDL